MITNGNEGFNIPSVEKTYEQMNSNTQVSGYKHIPVIDGANRNQLSMYAHHRQQNGYNSFRAGVDNNINAGCNNNRLGAGHYQQFNKIYICTENPNSPEPKTYEEIVLDESIYYRTPVSEDLIQTIINYLKVCGIGSIEEYTNYDELLSKELKRPSVNAELMNYKDIAVSKETVTAVSEELEYNDPIFGAYGDGTVYNDDQYVYAPLRYQFYCNFDKNLFVYTRDRMFIPIAKKMMNKTPLGLKNYVCAVKTYDLNPRYLDKTVIQKTLEYLAFNASEVKSVADESQIEKLKEIAIKNAVLYKNARNVIPKPVRIRIVTYIPESELKSKNYGMYIKSLGVTISDTVYSFDIDKIENIADEKKFVSSIKVITDSADDNEYYYRLNDSIINLPKEINNTVKSKILIEENNDGRVNTKEVELENCKAHEIYTDREELKSIINSNKHKNKELENKQRELEIKEKELSYKEKEIALKSAKIMDERHKLYLNKNNSSGSLIDDITKSVSSILGVASAGVGLGLTCWKLYSAVRG